MDNQQDLELKALLSCTQALDVLTPEARQRVLDYISSRFKITPLTQPKKNNQEELKEEKTPEKENESSKKTIKTKQAARKVSKNFKVEEINFYPDGKEKLKDFYNKYSPKNFFEKNLLFVYYLKEIINVETITPDHIYSCYKHTGQKVPGNLYQSLVDTGIRKGWIDTKNTSNIGLLIHGENYVEHEMLNEQEKK
ncbi:MAG TPA: hypothetical protein VNB90_02310 [Cytophagaceae bacterium]|jgi:hypothetical protein|nr:hypothetical protein [Cytophagaceae bacterium]